MVEFYIKTNDATAVVGGQMAKLIEEIPDIVRFVEDHKQLMLHNHDLFRMYEGDLKKYILEDLKTQLSINSYEAASKRVSPINVLRKVIDKLSSIYVQPPKRTCEGSEQDKELFAQYEEMIEPNSVFQNSNEMFNLHKNQIVEPYLDDDGNPRARSVPTDRAIVYSSDKKDPTRPTHYIKSMGQKKYKNGKTVDVFYVYSKDEFLPVTAKGEVLDDVLVELENPEGINPFGALPMVYANRSHYQLIPIPDSDIVSMSKLIPILLSDLNFATMFQCFSIFYTIDADEENLRMAPNALWNLKSDPKRQTAPQVGVIKPTVDINQVLQLVTQELAMWLQSKNIRPGQVGNLNAENFASGIAKVVDEMDTAEDRGKQVKIYKKLEQGFWDLLIQKMHPYWVSQQLIEERRLFTTDCQIIVEFPEQSPMVDREKLVNTILLEWNNGLITRRMALKKAHPEMTEDQITELEQALDEENTVVVNTESEDENPDDESETDAAGEPESEETESEDEESEEPETQMVN